MNAILRFTLRTVGAALVAGCAGSAPRLDLPAGNRVIATADRPLVIAHRGASGHRPEHTLEAYDLAITMGADYIEPDLVSTRDGVLVARHENEIGGTTDVGDRFADRKTTKVIDGDSVSGWFTEDFTLAELKTLRARERLPARSHAFDGQFGIPTFDEVLALVRRRERETGRTIGVYPETKHPSYFRELGLPLEDPLLRSLASHGWSGKGDAVFIQSFETSNLRTLRNQTSIRLVQLIDAEGQPYDLARDGDRRRVADLVSSSGLAEIARYADAIGVNKRLVVPVNPDGSLGPATALITDAHTAGLAVHVWTLRSDPPFLAKHYEGDPAAEWRHFARLGVDGIFGDFPDVGVKAFKADPRELRE